MIKHKPKFCDIADCSNEADNWIDVRGIGIDGIENETFYLCSDCTCKLMNEDGTIRRLSFDGKEIEEYEVGKYCCEEGCEVCND